MREIRGVDTEGVLVIADHGIGGLSDAGLRGRRGGDGLWSGRSTDGVARASYTKTVLGEVLGGLVRTAAGEHTVSRFRATSIVTEVVSRTCAEAFGADAEVAVGLLDMVGCRPLVDVTGHVDGDQSRI